MLVVHAKMPIRPDKRDDFLAAVGPLTEATRAEEGNVSYECFESIESPSTFMFVEEWQDQAALDFHGQTDHIKQAGAGLPELLAGAPELVSYETEGPQPFSL